MVIERYGIKLIKIRAEQIDEVRKWRNSPSISDFMEYQEYITSDMQKRWFLSLNELSDFYFVIEYKGKLMGLIHTSAIDWNTKEGHSGLFIWDKKFQNTHIPVLASLSMVDFFFGFCNLEKIFAKVKRSNLIAVKYNKNLGFQRCTDQSNKEFLEYRLDAEQYFNTTRELHRLAEEVQDKAYEITMENSLHVTLKAAGAFEGKSRHEEAALVVTL